MDLTALSTVRLSACDLNGCARGKRMVASAIKKLASGAARMPLSASNVDIWGLDIEDSPLVFETGDADGMLLPTNRGPVPMPWLATPSALILAELYHVDGNPFDGDPRQALKAVLSRFAAKGWTVMAATELEFTLVDDSGDSLRPPLNPTTGRRLDHNAVLGLQELDDFDAFFTDLYAGAEAMGIPALAAISEGGLGQFEVNLNHQDALRAADDCWLFKMLVKGTARKHGLAATFMAKPYADDAGNGMHVHFSVVDHDGRNVFDDGTETGSDLLRAAVAGCLVAMGDSTLIFAPHGNSYERLVPGAHAPTAAAWAYENRTSALRIPASPPAARRIEHRVAGGDVNPYLLLATILGAAFVGIKDSMSPPAPITGNAYEIDGLPRLAPSWEAAVNQVETSPLMPRILPPLLIENLIRTKRQEIADFAKLPPQNHWLSWLDRV